MKLVQRNAPITAKIRCCGKNDLLFCFKTKAGDSVESHFIRTLQIVHKHYWMLLMACKVKLIAELMADGDIEL